MCNRLWAILVWTDMHFEFPREIINTFGYSFLHTIICDTLILISNTVYKTNCLQIKNHVLKLMRVQYVFVSTEDEYRSSKMSI